MTYLDFNEITEQLDLLSFLDNEGIDYKESHGSSGEQVNLRTCPYCGNANWKVYANRTTGFGNCFRCNQTFNKLHLVKALLGDPSWSTVIELTKAVIADQGFVFKQKPVVEPVVEKQSVELPYSVSLPIGDSNLQYLEQRGIDIKIANYFDLRYCQDGEWQFKKDGQLHHQDFSKRVIIPIYDLNGDLVTFQGRDITGQAKRKYLFPSTLPSAGKFLYNGHNAFGASAVVLVEGVFDVFALKIAIDSDPRLRNVTPIGSFGKHLSSSEKVADDQLGQFIRLKQQGLTTVTIMWDGEFDALRAALRAGKSLQKIGLIVKIAFLPKGKDPNEVDSTTVVNALLDAQLLTAANCVKWTLNNPYVE